MQGTPVPPPGAPLVLTRERGRLALRLTCVPMGRDLAVTLAGGDRPHLGAVALSQPRPSGLEDGGTSASTSVITLLGHKEDELARSLAARLASGLGGAVCVACGIHLERIQAQELQDVLELAEDLALEALARLKAP